jgi:O-succinylbenzoate synthase
VPVNEVSALLENFKGCSTIKVKVNDFVNDHLILQEVLRLIPEAKIRLDVNGKWNLGSAIENLRNFEREFPNQIDYIEQPCSDIGDIASLRKESGLKIAVDESIRKNLGGELSKLQEVADVAIIKWAPTGGISAALEVIEKVNLPVVISSALDSSVGISHGLALAMATPNLYGACGLGTVGLLEGDVTSQPLLPENGFLSPRRINPDLLDRYRAKTERQKWWQDRVNKISSGGLN